MISRLWNTVLPTAERPHTPRWDSNAHLTGGKKNSSVSEIPTQIPKAISQFIICIPLQIQIWNETLLIM